MSSPQYPAARPAGREHIPVYPKGFIAVRIVQLVLSILIMGLSAYAVYYYPYDGDSFILAVAVMNIVDSVYHLVAHYGAPAIYNYWAVLGLDIFFVVMWLCAFALQAARVAPLFNLVNEAESAYGGYYNVGLTPTQAAWLDTQAAAAGLGGVQFILFIVTLVIGSIRLHRHRAEGLHCTPGVPPGPRAEKSAPAPAYHQPQYALHQQPQQPLPVYQQQVPVQQAPQQQPVYPPQAAPGGYPIQGQQLPPQQLPPQQQQPQQPVYYQHAPPQPSQSPAPVTPLVPQPTGGTVSTTTGGLVQHYPQNYPAQLPGHEAEMN